MSSLYQQFRASFNRQGADYSIIENAKGDARVQLENDLIANLDLFEIPALAMLNCQRALPALKRLLPTSSGTIRVLIARALWDLEGFDDAPGLICDILVSKPDESSWTERMDAAIALQNICLVSTHSALESGLRDEDYLVRYHSAQSLAANLGKSIPDAQIASAIRDGEPQKILDLVDRLKS